MWRGAWRMGCAALNKVSSALRGALKPFGDGRLPRHAHFSAVPIPLVIKLYTFEGLVTSSSF